MSTSISTSTRRRHGFGFWAIAVSFLTVMAFSTVPTPLWSLYGVRDGFSAFTVTIVFSAYAVGVAVSLFLAGHLSDRLGRRRVLVPALLAAIVAGVVFLVWPTLPGLLLARFVGGVGVGAATATATAWLGELHAVHRPGAPARHAQLVATSVNVGGLGVGALVSGMLAQWTGAPLTAPYVVFLVLLAIAVALALATPETRAAPVPLPPYRPQRVAVPAAQRGRFLAAAVGAMVSFAAFGLFTSLSPSFLAGELHEPSLVIAGVVSFAVFGAAVIAQAVPRTAHGMLVGAVPILPLGLVLLVVAVWLPTPSLAVFVAGGMLAGAGAGLMFRGAVTTVAAMASPDRRAEALAGIFLAAYIGIAGPVIGLGLLTLVVSPQTGLLVFAALLAVAVVAAAPALLRGSAVPAPVPAIEPAHV
jgi:MFS family permease